ncbi:MAG TPA: hypothetical protein VEL76_33745 [Gemmataceae bacterium]|nr:hypothetical protein [Gemmataceae bacterium]
MDQKCKRAIKILEQFERLAQKFKAKLSAARLAKLKALRDSGTIQAGDLPARLTRAFPKEFLGMSLAAIRKHCAAEED